MTVPDPTAARPTDAPPAIDPQQAPEQRILTLRPAIPMEYGRRYAVAFRGVVDGAGDDLPP